MPAAVTGHSHRATTKVNNKAFKSRKATKGAMRDQLKGKMSHSGEQSLGKTNREGRAARLQI